MPLFYCASLVPAIKATTKSNGLKIIFFICKILIALEMCICESGVEAEDCFVQGEIASFHHSSRSQEFKRAIQVPKHILRTLHKKR